MFDIYLKSEHFGLILCLCTSVWGKLLVHHSSISDGNQLHGKTDAHLKGLTRFDVFIKVDFGKFTNLKLAEKKRQKPHKTFFYTFYLN